MEIVMGWRGEESKEVRRSVGGGRKEMERRGREMIGGGKVLEWRGMKRERGEERATERDVMGKKNVLPWQFFSLFLICTV